MNLLLQHIKVFWRSFVLILTPIVLSPLAIIGDSREARCGYVILIMAMYWATEAVPIAVTALIPVFAFPLLGILSTNDTCYVYLKETNMMFLGGLLVAVSVEHSNLHRRIALKIILWIGQSPKKIAAGFMITTMFLSMWISNTATTVIMIPIVDAVLEEMFKTETLDEQDVYKNGQMESKVKSTASIDTEMSNLSFSELAEFENQKLDNEYEKIRKNHKMLRNLMFLATAYGANLGGTGSYTGTGPNLVLKDTLKSQYTEESDLTFATWMLYNIPGMLLCAVLTFGWLCWSLTGFCSQSASQASNDKQLAIKKVIERKYFELGLMSFQEKVVMTMFTTLVLLWFFLSPGFITGWGSLFTEKYGPSGDVNDATPAILIAFILFCIPSRPNFFGFRDSKANTYPSSSSGCLTWKVAQEKVPWGIILLLGGGFAMAQGANSSGLSVMLGEKLEALQFLPAELVSFLVSFMTAMFTEVASNTATASVFLPILNKLALSLCINPLYLLLPCALCCSYAFMLPVATPPNAIVFGAANMEAKVMIKCGFVTNIICIAVSTFMINFFAIPIFDIRNMPSWTNSTIDGVIKC